MIQVSQSHPGIRQRPESHLALPDRARILVIKLAGFGDVLLTMPALRALREAYPRARLDLLVDSATTGLVRDCPHVNHVLALPKSHYDTIPRLVFAPWRLRTLWRLARQLRTAQYDAVLLCHHLTLPLGRLKYRLLLMATGPALRIGLDNGHASFLDVCSPDQGFGVLHEADYALSLVRAIVPNAPVRPNAPTLADLGWSVSNAPHHTSATPADHQLRIALHPGSGIYSSARRWPLGRFAELARALNQQYGARITIVGGPDEGDLAARLQATIGHPQWLTTLPAGTSPRDLASMLCTCDLFIGNDSFPMHLAAAAGTPVVAIFGLSNHRAWRPLPLDATIPTLVVRRDLPCSPCFYVGLALGTPRGCPPRDCLTELPVAVVLRHAQRALRMSTKVGPTH